MNSSKTEKLCSVKKTDFWQKDGHDFILNLGSMKKAIVVAAYVDSEKSIIEGCFLGRIDYYAISPRSYFPFNNDDLERKFNNSEECKSFAIDCIKNWLKSIFNIEWTY